MQEKNNFEHKTKCIEHTYCNIDGRPAQYYLQNVIVLLWTYVAKSAIFELEKRVQGFHVVYCALIQIKYYNIHCNRRAECDHFLIFVWLQKCCPRGRFSPDSCVAKLGQC